MPDKTISQRLSDLESSLARIEQALIGDEDLGQEGLAKRVHAVEELVESHAKIVLNVKARLLGALFASSVIGGFLNWLLGVGHGGK